MKERKFPVDPQEQISAERELGAQLLTSMSPTVPQRAACRLPPPEPRLVRFEGDPLLLNRLEEPLRRALGRRPAYYQVRIETVGRCGEILVSILGAKGRLPLIFGQEELEPAYVASVVRDTVEKYGL